MDQAFDFRAAPVPLRRRLNPRAIVLVVTACLVLCGVVGFSRWVTASERRSVELAEASSTTTSIIGTIGGGDVALADAIPVADRLAIDVAARSDARAALGAARDAAAGRATFLDAGPGQLGAVSTSLVFVDGSSPVPGVVSVASTARSWAAAVMGPSGTCYWISFSPARGTTYGTGRACTGDAALGAGEPSW
jgi:hypothetical protein